MKVIISDIPGFFPSGYTEQMYLDARAERDGQDIVTYKTEQKHQAVNDESYRQRKIQTVFYDKYKFELITTESVNIDLINVADSVSLTLDNGEIHEAEFIDIPQAEYLKDSSFRKYVLSYRDLNSKSTIDQLVYSSVINPTYYTLIKYNGGTKYTKLYPDFGITPFEQTENKDNYISMISSENALKTISATFYIENGNIPNFIKKLSFDNLALTYMQIGSTQYTPLETPVVEVEESELEGISPVKITISYEQILNYPYV